jgi:hypothetical protein
MVQKPTRNQQTILDTLANGGTLWAPRYAGSAWLCPPHGDPGPARRVRFATIEAMVGSGWIEMKRGSSFAAVNDTAWTPTGMARP